MNTIPLWVVANLGKKVLLTKGFQGAVRTYPAGWKGTLISIQAPIKDRQRFGVTVALDADDLGYEENFSVDEIRPAADHMSVSLNFEKGLMRF
jgi:hypothetical protein